MRTRILSCLGLGVLALIAAMSLVSDLVLKTAFERLESVQAGRMRQRITEALREQEADLRRIAGDWAPWDETYAFVLGDNPGYIQQNLTPTAFANLDVHLLLFYNARGERVYGATIDRAGAWSIELHPDIIALPDQHPDLLNDAGSDSPNAHRLSFGGMPHLVVAHPVLTSEHTGPVAGTLVFGRRIDTAMAQRITRLVQNPVQLHTAGEGMTHDHDARLHVCILLNDEQGTPIAEVVSQLPKELSREYERTKTFLYLSLLATGIFLALVALWIIERWLLQPMTRQVDLLLSIRDPLHDQRRLPAAGHGETDQLARAVNAMIDTIQQGEQARAQALSALADEKENLATTLRSIGDGVITTDTAGRVGLMNAAAEALTGWTREAALGQPVSEVLDLRDEESRKPLGNRNLHAPAETAAALPPAAWLVARDGRERLVRATAAPIRRGEDLAGAVIVFRDETDARLAENARIRANKLESIGVLAGGIAHDFNNILTAIMANLSLARMSDTAPEEARQFLEETERSLEQARALTQQLLTFASGGEPVKRVVSLRDLLAEAVPFALRGSSVTAAFQIATDLPAVHADPGQLAQVINNLVINAVEAMPGGGAIHVGAHAEPADPSTGAGPMVRVEIRDTGPGIAPENLARIFDPYFSTKARGSGLGLATSYSIIRKHGGRITARSAPGTGTTMVFWIPASSQPAPVAGAGHALLVGGAGRILLMDDERDILEATSRILARAGYTVQRAREGREAVAMYREALAAGAPFDAVITDLTVPGGMGGVDATRAMLALHPEARIIASSGYSNDPVMSDFRRHGFCAVLPKPYSSYDLTRTLQDVIAGEAIA